MAKAALTVEEQRKAELDSLPTWDLTEFYDSIEDPQIKADLDKAGELADAFAAKYKGRIASLSGDEIAQAIEEELKIDLLGDKPAYYASYLRTIDQNDPNIAKFEQAISEAGTEIAQKTMFFGLELKAMSREDFDAKIAESPALAHYAHLVDNIVKSQPFKLSDELEEFLVRQSPAGAGQFVRLYTEDAARRRYEFRGEELTQTAIRNKMSQDPDPDVRKEAAEVYFAETARNIHIPTFVMNNILKNKAIMDEERGFAEPMSSRNLSNDVDDAVVHTMIDTVIANYPATTHRYNALLADMLGKDELDYWDRNASIPGHVETYIPWEKAKEMVLEGYREFSPKMAEIAEKFFEEGWIDAKPRPSKRGGAYSSGGHPDVHPQVMLNYMGSPRDVMTLAHELGHGVHQYLENEALGPILRGTPLNLAETASIFGENIVFQRLLKEVKDPTERKLLLAEKVSDELATITRQVSFADFERKIHNARKEGELSADDFAQHWIDARKAEQGNQGELKLEDYKHGWSNIPHMFRTPFYVYAYSFANLVVNGLVEAHKEGNVPNFEDKYLDALRAGGTKDYAQLLKPFGIDAHSSDFWQKGMDVVIGHIDQLEQAIAEERALKASLAPANDDQPVSIDSVEVAGAAQAAGQKNARGK